MKELKLLFIITLLINAHYTKAQVNNDAEFIQKNKVKFSIQKHCFANSESSCSVIYEKYDKRGHIVEWNMSRLGTIYRSAYDKNDNLILTLWVDKSDTNEVDSIIYEYDKYHHLIKKKYFGETTEYENVYDHKKRLTKTLSKSKNYYGNTVLITTTKSWTAFDKIKSEHTQSEILKKDWETNPKNKSKIEYDYDQNHNLIKEIFYQADTINKLITYRYDDQNRCIEKIKDDPAHSKRVNSMNFSNRNDIKVFTTKTEYNEEGQIDELYTYFSDPCLSLDDHYLYKHHYLENGLIDFVDVFKKDELEFTIQYEYEYYE